MSEQQIKSQPALAEATRDIYDLLTGDEDARVCKDIPDSACNDQPQNFVIHVSALSLTKTGDGFFDVKLVVAWLLSSLGAPAFMTALLVPLRESLALAPQLVISAVIRRFPVRKWFWVGGSLGQAASLLGIALVAGTLTGAQAGYAILGLLAVFSLSRGVCSISNKDVVGKTVSKTHRGKMSGYAGTVSGIAVGALGLYFAFLAEGPSAGVISVVILVAAVLWVLAAIAFAFLEEVPGATEGGGNALDEALKQMTLIVEDRQFRYFVLSRALLVGAPLAVPFYVSLAERSSGESIAGLGWLTIGSGLAAAVSSAVWGHLSDRSSRQVMMVAGGLAGALGLFVFLIGGFLESHALGQYAFATVIFVAALSHAGIRLGRKTHLVDMAPPEQKAPYVAVSNTILGLVLLISGLTGAVAGLFGIYATIGLLAFLSCAGAAVAFLLEEVQQQE